MSRIVRIVLKPVLFILATLLVCACSGCWLMFPICLLEILVIFLLSERLYLTRPKLAYALNLILGFFYSAELVVFGFSGEFISPLMLENINMISNLGNELVVYVIASVIAAVILFLPVGKLILKSGGKWLLPCTLVLYCVALVSYGLASKLPASPYSAICRMATDAVSAEVARSISLRNMDKEEILAYFHRDSIPGTDVCLKDSSDTGNMSVILILTEGLSAEVLDIYNSHDRNLTPNLDALSAQSWAFDNYYNHTAATFRAVRGQLYSSHQYDGGYVGGEGLVEVDADVQRNMLDVELVSIVDILKSNGYNVCYVNPEPGDAKIVNYARSFRVDSLASGEFGHQKARTDRQIFDVLTNVVRDYRRKSEPYFIIFYNLGTHHGFDSPDLKYGDGTDSYLNKFHNYDAAFGEFFNVMKEEGVFDDTMLIFSADHATYPVPEYKKTFSSSQEFFISRIPLFFYVDGIEPCRYDVCGRNSLDLAPTILDLLDIEDAENWFLGTSLFRDDEQVYSHLCAMGSEFFHVGDNGVIRLLQKDPLSAKLRWYYEISINK